MQDSSRFFDWFRSKPAPRKFVDLILRVTNKWANWDPPTQIKAGDYGVLNKDTGMFEREGNIYTSPPSEAVRVLAKEFPPVQSPPEKAQIISSFQTRRKDATAQVGAADTIFAVEIELQKKRGAFLGMSNPTTTSIPDEFCHRTIQEPSLRGKQLITEVIMCNAFIMYFSNKNKETVSVVLKADPQIGASGGVGFKWDYSGGGGYFREGTRPTLSYTPLFVMKNVRTPDLRRYPGANVKEDWYESDVPWDALDDNGEEDLEEFESD